MNFITRHGKWILLHVIVLLIIFTSYRLFIFNKFNTTNAPFVSNILWLGFRFDVRVIGIVLLPIFIITSNMRLSPFYQTGAKRFWQGYLLLIYIAIAFIFVTDYQYFAYRNSRLDAEIIELAKDAKVGAQMVWQSYPVLWMLLGIAVFIIAIHFLINKIYIQSTLFNPIHIKKRKNSSNIILGLLLAIGIYGKFKQFPLRWSDAFAVTKNVDNNQNNFLGTMVLNPMQSFVSSLKARKENGSIDSVKKYFAEISKLYQLPTTDSANPSFVRTINSTNTNKPNVVLVICESFAMYKTNMVGNPLNPTPYFDQLRKDGLFFQNAFSPAYGTARGVWATVTGIPDASFSQASTRNPRSVNQHTIINDFTDYEKYYFLGGDASWANIRGVLKNNISDLHLYEQHDFSSPTVDVWGISDRDLFKEATQYFNKEKKPFFSVIQTSSNHRPFTIPSKDEAEMGIIKKPLDSLIQFGFNVERNEAKTNKEFNSVRYMDFCINEFMENAKKQSWYDNTIFLFVGDHGIRNWDAKQIPKVFVDKGITCQHVPMLIYGSKIKPQHIDFPVSQLDVLPTLAGYAGISYKNTTLGRDLFKVIADTTMPRFAFIMDHDRKEYGIYKDNMFYVNSIAGKGEDFQIVYPNLPKSNNSIQHYRTLANGIFQTSKYLIFNNKK